MSDNEVLVVASKIKTYIKNSGDMKTSAGVLNVLSDRLRAMCDQAIIVKISRGKTSSIVEILVLKNIEIFGLTNQISKVNSRFTFGQI